MKNFDYTNVSGIKALLEENGFAMCKKFGQNFLISADCIRKITDEITKDVIDETIIYEIGPGIGVLTSELIKKDFKVHAYEIDRGFINILKEFFSDGELEITEGDVLKTIEKTEICPLVICGNLPYNISSVLIAHILEKKLCGTLPQRMVFLLQKEVAQRLTARFEISSLSLLCSIDYDTKIAFDIKRHCFFPSPKVDSSLVVFDKKPAVISDEILRQKFIKLVRILFSQRRKTIKNNMLSAGISDAQYILDTAGVSPSCRAEELSMNDFIRISENCTVF